MFSRFSVARQKGFFWLILCTLLSHFALSSVQAQTQINIRIQVEPNPMWARPLQLSSVSGAVFVYNYKGDASGTPDQVRSVRFNSYIPVNYPAITSYPLDMSSCTLTPITSGLNAGGAACSITISGLSNQFYMSFASAGLNTEFVGFTRTGSNTICRTTSCELYTNNGNSVSITANFRSTALIEGGVYCNPNKPIPVPQNCLSIGLSRTLPLP